MKKETMLLSFLRHKEVFTPYAKATRSRVSKHIRAENRLVANPNFSSKRLVLGGLLSDTRPRNRPSLSKAARAKSGQNVANL
jgi:hypothetical protein